MLDKYKLRLHFGRTHIVFGNTYSIRLILKEAQVGSEARFPYLLENVVFVLIVFELCVKASIMKARENDSL